MTCSEMNFVQSQHFYGLCIAKKDELPLITASDSTWLKYLGHLNRLSEMSATMQINANKKRKASHA